MSSMPEPDVVYDEPKYSPPETVLRWVGSKRATARQIAKSVEERLANRYFEPFFGAGSVFFALGPTAAILGDANVDLMLTWEQIQRTPKALHARVAQMPTTESTFYNVRENQAIHEDPFERAVQFTYLNRNCFNGLYRTNRHGFFNVPFGRSTGGLPSEAAFKACSAALATAQLRVGDFEDTACDAREGDVVYMDPPYWTSNFDYGEYGYTKHPPVTPDRIERFATTLAERGAEVFVSAPHDAEVLSEYPRVTLEHRYQISASALKRRRSQEILIHLSPGRSR